MQSTFHPSDNAQQMHWTSVPGNSAPPKTNIFWKGLKITWNFFIDTQATVAVLTITGIALRIFSFTSFSVPFFAMSGAILATRLVVKLINHYNVSALRRIKIQASNIIEKYPNLQIITFLFAIALSLISIYAAIVVAITVGILSGILIEVNIANRKQSREAQADTEYSSTISQLLSE